MTQGLPLPAQQPRAPVRQRVLVQSAKPRRLGSLFIPIRQTYLFVMPLLLFSGAMVCWTIGTDTSMIGGGLILAGVAVFLLFDLLGRRSPLRVSTILAITLGLAYGLGTVNTWYTLPRGDASLGEFLHINPTDLSHAMGSVMTSVALLLGLGELLEKPVFGEDFELKFTNRAVVFLTIGTIILGASFAHGSTGFMGGTVGEDGEIGRVGYLASLSEWLSGSLFAMSVCITLNTKGKFTRIYTRLLSILLFLMVFPLGRRQMIFAVLLALLTLRLGGYKVPFSWIKKTVLLGALGMLIYFASIGFFYLRIAGYGLLRPTLVQRVTAALALANTRSYSDIKEEFSKNVQTRTFILGFLGQLEGYTDTMPAAHGYDIEHQFQLALPSILFPSKDIFFSEEGLANELFGANYIDEANSILTAGAVDFGIWGMFAYPLLVVLMIRVFFEYFSQAVPVFASCFVIVASFSILLEPELAADSYFLVIRSGILFGTVVWILMSLPEFRVKNVGL